MCLIFWEGFRQWLLDFSSVLAYTALNAVHVESIHSPITQDHLQQMELNNI